MRREVGGGGEWGGGGGKARGVCDVVWCGWVFIECRGMPVVAKCGILRQLV